MTFFCPHTFIRNLWQSNFNGATLQWTCRFSISCDPLLFNLKTFSLLALSKSFAVISLYCLQNIRACLFCPYWEMLEHVSMLHQTVEWQQCYRKILNKRWLQGQQSYPIIHIVYLSITSETLAPCCQYMMSYWHYNLNSSISGFSGTQFFSNLL